MEKQKRLFLAIKIKPEEKFLSLFQSLTACCSKDKIKWVNIENLHITLKFFGETDVIRIPEISNIIKNTLKNINEFQFEISEIGIFGSSYQPKVIWLGIKNANELKKMAFNFLAEFDKIGFLADRQNFVPHLTLGRINFVADKKLFFENIKNLNIQNIQKVKVDEIILYESILKKEGPAYIVIEKYKLG
jgi:2'-5' RNA ligase